MSNYKIDSKFAQEASAVDIDNFGTIPQGQYIGKFTDIEEKSFPASSGFMLAFVISEGQHAGMRSSLYLPLVADKEAALGYSKLNMKKLFIAAGFNAVGSDLGAVLNKPMRIEIKHRVNGDKTYSSISNIFDSVSASGRISAANTGNAQPAIIQSEKVDDGIPF